MECVKSVCCNVHDIHDSKTVHEEEISRRFAHTDTQTHIHTHIDTHLNVHARTHTLKICVKIKAADEEEIFKMVGCVLLDGAVCCSVLYIYVNQECQAVSTVYVTR